MIFNISWKRLKAVIVKEFIQMRRDRLTFAMMIGMPLIQLVLFGYAINTNPKHLPTAIISSDHSALTRTFVAALQNTEYFNIVNPNVSEQQAEKLLSENRVQFVVQVPSNFSSDLVHGEQPQLLVIADATDPTATASAVSALNVLANSVFNRQRGNHHHRHGQHHAH